MAKSGFGFHNARATGRRGRASSGSTTSTSFSTSLKRSPRSRIPATTAGPALNYDSEATLRIGQPAAPPALSPHKGASPTIDFTFLAPSYDRLVELNGDGTTVFLSSHLLAEVEHLCDRVGVLDRGRLVVQDRLDALRGPTGRLHVRTRDMDRARALLDGTVERVGNYELLVRHDDPAALNRLLVESGVRVHLLAPEHRTLEDVVLEATGAGSDRVAR